MIKGGKLLFIFGVLLLFSIVMLLIQNINIPEFTITGAATEGTTSSNVTIEKYLSIDLSDNLSEGIIFGNLNPDIVHSNATHNYDGASDGSTMLVNVSADSNTAVDFCIKANTHLISDGGDIIGLGNESYCNNATTTDIITPSLVNKSSLTTSYVKSGNNISIGDDGYYRFWLNVTSGQASGDYNNTISFKGIEIGAAC